MVARLKPMAFVTRLGPLFLLTVLFLRLCDLLSADRDLNLLTHTIPLLLATLLKDLPVFLANSVPGFLFLCLWLLWLALALALWLWLSGSGSLAGLLWVSPVLLLLLFGVCYIVCLPCSLAVRILLELLQQ